ncbi:armadillo-type protein [Aspergillus crustosus]
MSIQHTGVTAQNLTHQLPDCYDTDLDCPTLSDILAESAQFALEPPRAETLPFREQEALFDSVQLALRKVDLEGAFDDIPNTLAKLWHCQSQYLIQAVEALANGSRNPSLRLVYGRTGVLTFFLRLIASINTEDTLILHCLRLIGNSCADTTETGLCVAKADLDDNRASSTPYTYAILRHLLRPELIKVVIPVIYNLCIDYEPAQIQLAVNKIVHILLTLLEDNAFGDEVEYVYELIELVGEQGIDSSPDGTISLLLDLLLKKDDQTLYNCLVAYLNKKPDVCMRFIPAIISVLEQSDPQTLAQTRLKINHGLAELSDSPLFAQLYPLDSSLSQTLRSWVTSSDDQLQICACIMLGNLARSDDICVAMVRAGIHKDLIAVLETNTRGAVLHSAIGFLKNLAIASDNRLLLGAIIPVLPKLWSHETVPQVQLAATSIARQLILQPKNIDLILQPISHDETHLSLLLALCQKTDSIPIKTEIGRIVASLCRSLGPVDRLTRHRDIALPLGAMVNQTQWPVVRSEGWFALAFMASVRAGAEAVIHGLNGFSLIEQTLAAEAPDTDEIQWRKDRDNIVVLVQELLKNQPDMTAPVNSVLRGLIKSHVSRYVFD